MINEEQKEILKAAIKLYGYEAQTDMIQEECMELAMAIQKHNRNASDERYANIIDEIADVSIMIEQAKMIFGHEKIQERIDFKIKRLSNNIIR